MIASELIAKLQEMIDTHGDFVVALEVDCFVSDAESVSVNPEAEWIYIAGGSL